MTVDLYTKSVLTVIAACLVYMCLGGPEVLPSGSAQVPSAARTATDPTEVVIVGYRPSGQRGLTQLNATQGLPVQVVNR
jgi:hypothetical protein